MNLTSGSPFWLTQHGLPPRYPTLDHDLTCDVAVLGAGVSGALVSDALAAAGLRVAVLDKHYPGTGATSASTALLQFELDVQLRDLRLRYSDAARADAAWRAVYGAFRRIQTLATELGGATIGYQPTTSLYLASSKGEVPELALEAEARQQLSLPSEFLTGAEVAARYGIERPGAILSHEAGQLDALQLTRALHQRAAQRGTQLFERTEVVRYDADPAGVTLTTAHNFRVRARHVIVCTGYETPEWLRGIRVTLKSSFALVTEPLTPADRWPTDCHIWETARPYVYARTLPDGRVMAGGADLPFDNATAREALLRRRTHQIEAKLRELLPRLPLRIDFRWAGTFAETADGLPYVSQHPRFPHTWFALGFGGNGIVFATLAADLITAALTGEERPETALFAFNRPGV
ncbi:MAG: FAD-binding oxidoreductase [Hymenobacteraceae bacterium]|nr:FAD-binding oxidoreductase [Hymenobacteraceae bacterium]